MASGRRMPLWFVIWLLMPVLAAGAAGIWYLAAGRDQPGATQQVYALPREEQPAADATPKPPAEIPARILARGDLDFPFLAYETFGPGRIALAAPAAAGHVSVLVAEFKNGDLLPVSRVQEPMGAVLDLTRGDLLNNGGIQALVTTEKGFLLLLGTERYLKQEEAGLERVFVGDWDNDGQAETGFLHQQKGAREVTLIRYGPDGQGTTLGSFPAPAFPTWSAVLDRPGEPSLLMGAERGEAGVQVAFYRLHTDRGLEVTARYPLHADEGQAIASFTAGNVAGRPTLAVSFQAVPSFLELFDTAAEGMPSRGRIHLPDDDVYLVLLGTFTGQARTEFLAITPLGQWILYGLD